MYIFLPFIEESAIFVLAIDAFRWDKWILVDLFQKCLYNIILETIHWSYVTDVKADQSHCANNGYSDQCIHPCAIWSVFIN